MNSYNLRRTGRCFGFINDVASVSFAFVLTAFIFWADLKSIMFSYFIFLPVTLLFLVMFDAYEDLCSYETQKNRLHITLSIVFIMSVCITAVISLIFFKHSIFNALQSAVFFALCYILMFGGRMFLLKVLCRIRKTQILLILYFPGCPEDFLNKLKQKADDFGKVVLKELKENDIEDDAKEAVRDASQVLLLANIPLELRDKYILFALSNGKITQVIPTVENLSLLGGRISHIGDTPVIALKNAHLLFLEKMIKRCFDFTASLIGLILLSPLFLICAVAIKIDSKGDVFYKQERYTLYKKKFNIIKFRTMVQDAEKSGARLATENDSRITKAGKILRACRIDELPQLINILKGEMSFVGPRPERPVYADSYSKMVKNYDTRYLVKAGLTGYAQIYGQYNTKVSDKVLFDSIYINNFSVWLDLKLIVQTALIMFISESTQGVDEKLAVVPKQEQKNCEDEVLLKK